MAKYGRYDPRNKKKDRNKSRSINKELRIRDQDEHYEHKFKGQKIEWVILDELEEEYDD